MEDGVEEVIEGVEDQSIPDHMIPVYERGCEHLNDSQKKTLKRFAIKNQDCFARPGEVGRTNMGVHKIKLKDEKPVREPPRRVPLYKKTSIGG